jgi:hypothetical protein
MTTPQAGVFNKTFGTLTGPDSSSLVVVTANGFITEYGDGTIAVGDLVTDTVTVGGVTFDKFEFGFAYAGGTPEALAAVPFTGVAGVSYTAIEAEAVLSNGTKTYPTLLTQLVTQGLIGTQAFSLYLDDISEHPCYHSGLACD